jgi:hypothetical protein
VAALCALALLASFPAVAADCVMGKAKLKPVMSLRSGLAVEVPADWDCLIEEYSDGLVIRDGKGACRLELQRNPGGSAPESAALYESIYFGPNELSPSCRREVSERVAWPDETAVGQYSLKGAGSRVAALFASVGDETLVALLKCPRKHPLPEWGVASAVFASIRRLARDNWWSGYFLRKIPLNLSHMLTDSAFRFSRDMERSFSTAIAASSLAGSTF